MPAPALRFEFPVKLHRHLHSHQVQRGSQESFEAPPTHPPNLHRHPLPLHHHRHLHHRRLTGCNPRSAARLRRRGEVQDGARMWLIGF